MSIQRPRFSPAVVAGGVLLSVVGLWALWAATPPADLKGGVTGQWRSARRIIDLHMHIDSTPERLDRAIGIMNRAGIGLGVNLSGGTVTPGADGISEFEKNKQLADGRHPGRFLQYMNLDYRGWDEPDFGERAARQIELGDRLGAAGLKEYKRLGLFLRDGQGKLIAVDDPKLDPVWAKCGELGMPVSIHVADPEAFWRTFDSSNERWKELKDHRNWWFGDPAQYPSRTALLEALNRVIARHPRTTFVCVHFANNAEDLAWVDAALDRYPNMMADLAARIPELGRHAPEEVRRVFTKHAGRILFASDFMVYDRLILGSAGDAERPTDEDGVTFFEKSWRWLETHDRDWAHMTPIQGDWTISAIGLPPEVSRKIYFDNARKLLARSLPLPILTARQAPADFVPDGRLDDPAWQSAVAVPLEVRSSSGEAVPELSTSVRACYTPQFFYLAYEAPFTQISTFPDPAPAERIGLWDQDVVEAFIGTRPDRLDHYTEFEWAPNGEQLDLKIEGPSKDFGWSSGMQSVALVDEPARIWRVEVRIPMKALTDHPPQPGSRWRLNLYRHDKASGTGLAWSPTLTGTFHTPARFGQVHLE